MIDRDVQRRRTAHVLHHIDRLRGRMPITEEGVRQDEDLWSLVLMDLQQAIQGCIDLATHACVDDQLGSPSTAAEAFTLLEKSGRLKSELTLRLIGAAGLRNLIVHQYGDLLPRLVIQILDEGLNDLEAFLRATTDWSEVE